MLSIIMIFSVVAPINVISFAQEAPQLELSVPDTSYFEIVTATVSAKGMSDLQSVDLELYYDADYFEFVEFTSISDGISSYAYDTADGNTNLSAVLFDNYDVDDDILFTATFKVKKSGTTEMRLVVDNWEAAQTPADTSTVVNVASSPYILIAEDNSTIEVDYFSKIVKISERTEVSDIYTSISNESVSLTDADGNSVNDTDLVATGYVLTCDTMAYTVVVPGDVDSNGKVNASDARKALRNSAMLEILTDAQFLAADIDESGTITASDARAILRISAAIEKAPEIVPAEPITSPDETTTAEPTSEEATTAEVTTVEVTTAESTTAEITTAETTTAEPTTAEPTTAEPTTAEPATEEPATDADAEDTVLPDVPEDVYGDVYGDEDDGIIVDDPEEAVPVESEYPEVIDAFFSSNFYMEMISDGSLVKVATNGTKTEMSMDLGTLEMSVYSDGKKVYIKFPYDGKKYYINMNAISWLSSDLDVDEMAAELQFDAVTDYTLTDVSQTEKDGVLYNVYTFTLSDDTTTVFYADENGDIKYIAGTGVDGDMELEALTTEIPSDMLTLDGFKKDTFGTNLIAAMTGS